MEKIDIREAEADLPRLVERVSTGEGVVIAKDGKPMVKLVPLTDAEQRPMRRIGFMEGEFKTPEDFDRMGEDEIAEMFYGSR